MNSTAQVRLGLRLEQIVREKAGCLLEYFAGRSSVLCFSHDWSLLITRQWLLERIGAAFISVMSEQEMKSKLLDLSPEIIILCQTLSSEECDAALDLANRLCPLSRCVVLCSPHHELSPRHMEMSAESRQFPAEFLASLKKLLAQSKEQIARI